MKVFARVSLGACIGIAILAGIEIFFPWLPIESIHQEGLVIEGCENHPVWFAKGSVYDCNSYARKRYDQHYGR